jgi:hypothetical protein
MNPFEEGSTMSLNTGPARGKPQSDDRAIWDVIYAFWAAPALLVAHDLKLFTLLGEKPRTLAEVSASLGSPERSTEVLLRANAAFGFIVEEEGTYRLSRVAADYLDEKSPTNLAGYLNFLVANHGLWSVPKLKAAVLTNSAQLGGQGGVFSTPEGQKAFAKIFTRAMYAHSIGSAFDWPDKVDLSENRILLDVGGGSGAHTVGALLRWPELTGIVLDTPPVIAEAREYVGLYEVADRIELRPGDMWQDAFPPADVHLYGDILHDWPKEKGEFLATKSFESLSTGGRIILREVLFNDDKSGPLPAAAYEVDMLLATAGGQYSKAEIMALLTRIGFRDVQIGPPGAGYRSLIVARKR